MRRSREKEVVAGLAVQTTDPASRRGTSYTKLRSHWNRRPWWKAKDENVQRALAGLDDD